MDKILTIAVAVYNIENYLDQCLSSFADDRLKNSLEVLVINDGSKDSSLEIANKYKRNYLEIFTIIDKQNGGYGTTFYEGFKNASGKYYKVVDGDDYVDTESLILLIDKLQTFDVDVCFTKSKKFDSHSGKINGELTNLQSGYLSDTVYPIEKFSSNTLFFHISNVVFRTSLLRENNISVGDRYYVDLEYNFYPLFYAKNVVFFDLSVTNYRVNQTDNSSCFKNLIKNAEQYAIAGKRLIGFYTQHKTLPFANSIYVSQYLALQLNVCYYYYFLNPINSSTKMKMLELNSILQSHPEIECNLPVKLFLKSHRTYRFISIVCRIRLFFKSFCG